MCQLSWHDPVTPAQRSIRFTTEHRERIRALVLLDRDGVSSQRDVGGLRLTVVAHLLLVGIAGQKIPRDVLIAIVILSAVLSVWIVALQTPTYKGRHAFVGCLDIA